MLHSPNVLGTVGYGAPTTCSLRPSFSSLSLSHFINQKSFYAKQRGANSPPLRGEGTQMLHFITTAASNLRLPYFIVSTLTINLMPYNYCAFGRKPAPSARMNLSLACSSLLAFSCYIAVRDTRSEWPVGTRPEKEGRNKRFPARTS